MMCESDALARKLVKTGAHGDVRLGGVSSKEFN